MLYREMPNGDKLSILGFGCMRLPSNPDRTINREEATKQIRGAIDKGINYLDTAWPYHGGESEELLGYVLRDGYREKVKLTTKLPTWLVKTREDMDSFISQQLAKLQTDYVDYYLLHGIDGGMWKNLLQLGVKEFLDDIKARGLTKNVGFSFHGTQEEFIEIINDYDWDVCQIQYNFLDTHHQAGTKGLKYAASKKIGVIIMEPLRGGKLVSPIPKEVEELWDTAKIARTPAEWALRWVWNHPEVNVVLSGMNADWQIEENMATADEAYPESLTKDELALVKQVAKKYTKLMKIGCTGCNYCQPCPMGVDIPDIFETYNHFHIFGDEDETKFGYTARRLGIFTNKPYSFAHQCSECGRCEDLCPQKLNIIDLLKKTREDLENEELPDRVALIKMIFGKE